MREKHCRLVADKPSEQDVRRNHRSGHLLITVHETLNGRATSHLSGPLNRKEIIIILM
jgi:hypothetical protein